MREDVKIDASGGSIQVRCVANGAGVARTSGARLFDKGGKLVRQIEVVHESDYRSGVDLDLDEALQGIVWLRVSVASLVDSPELVGATATVHQDQRVVEHVRSKRVLLASSGRVDFDFILDFEEANG